MPFAITNVRPFLLTLIPASANTVSGSHVYSEHVSNDHLPNIDRWSLPGEFLKLTVDGERTHDHSIVAETALRGVRSG